MSDDAPKTGRPSNFSQELAELICERLANGEPLARICADPDMPGYSTVRRWEDVNPAFLAVSLRARANGTHYIADDCMRIADDPVLDPKDKRVRIDTRLRLIGKWNAKAYGDKLDLTADLNLKKPALDLSGLDDVEKDALLLLLEKADLTAKKEG